MKEEKKKMNRKQDGFTLVELIVVLVILSVVSAIAVPSVLGYIDDGKAKECKSRLNALAADIATAKLSYEVDGEDGGDKFGHDKIQEYIENAGEDGKCPLGDTYEAVEDTQIKCPKGHAICNIEDAGSFSVAKLEVEENTEKRESPDATATPPEETTPTPDNTGEDTNHTPTPTPTPAVHTYSVEIEPGPLDMETGETEDLQVTVYDEEGNKVPEEQIKDVTWTFPANGVVQGTESGKMAASVEAQVAGSGEIQCTVTIEDENGTTSTSKGSVDVTVEDSKPQLQLDVSPVPPVEAGKDTEIDASVKDAEGNLYTGTDVTVTYKSERPDIAQVDPSTGEVHGVAPGECDVTVTLKDKAGNVLDEKTVKVKVTDPEPKTQPSVELSVPESVDLEKGKGEEITAGATSKGLDGKDVKYTYEWESKDASVKVDKTSEDGSTVTVTGETAGEYDITCKVTGTYTDENGNQQTVTDEKTIHVNVEEPQTETQSQPELDLEVPPLTVKEGEEGKLEPKATGGSGKYTYEYRSVDPETVTVDEDGTVHGNKHGKAEVEVTVTDTETKEQKSVTVEVAVTQSGELFNPKEFHVWAHDNAGIEIESYDDAALQGIFANLPKGTWYDASGGYFDVINRADSYDLTLFPKKFGGNGTGPYTLRFVTEDDREDTLTFTVGYPIKQIDNIEWKNAGSEEMRIGEELHYIARLQPDYTTDVPIDWGIIEAQPENMKVDIVPLNDSCTEVKIIPREIGTFVVQAHARCQEAVEKNLINEIDKYRTDNRKHTVKYADLSQITVPSEIDVEEGTQVDLEVQTVPSTGIGSVTYQYDNPGTDYFTVKDGKITGIKSTGDQRYNLKVIARQESGRSAEAICGVKVLPRKETEAEKEEVSIDGKRFKATSWEAFQKAVKDDPKYKNNEGWDKNDPDERDSPIYYDEIRSENGIIERRYYVAVGTGIDYEVDGNSERRTNVKDSKSFEEFITKHDNKTLFVEISEDSIKNVPSFSEEYARNSAIKYPLGTIVKIIRENGTVEYYIANIDSENKRKLSDIFATEKTDSGWWRLDILS